MLKIDESQFVWVEKYRPQTIDDLIIDEETRRQFKNWIDKDGQIPNLGLFSNQPGTGKTSFSKALINDLEADKCFINASKDNGIDIIRGKIQDFASGVSFDGKPKIIVMDECDATTPAFQDAFRGMIEEFSKNCRFILTGNTASKISKPILSRLINFDFDSIYTTHSKELVKQIYSRCLFILDTEKVQYTKEDVKSLILNKFPSVREIIMTLQESAKFDEEGNRVLKLSYTFDAEIDIYNSLIEAIANKNSASFQQIVRNVSSPTNFFRYVYKNLTKIFADEESIGTVCLKIVEYLDYSTTSRDDEILIMGFCYALVRESRIKFRKGK